MELPTSLAGCAMAGQGIAPAGHLLGLPGFWPAFRIPMAGGLMCRPGAYQPADGLMCRPGAYQPADGLMCRPGADQPADAR